MTEVLIDHAPRVRCYECGEERIFSLCHHCQRPMCKPHSPFAFRQGGTLVRTPTGAADEARPASKELAGLRLGGEREAVYHCKDHHHIVRGVPLLWIGVGAAIAALGVLLLFASARAGMAVLLVGAATGGIPFLIHRLSTANAFQPRLPLVPQVNTVDIVERLTGYVRLETGEYTSTVSSITGRMTVGMSANDGHLLLHAYRRKFGFAESDPVPFTAGFLMLEGDAGLAFRPGQPPVLAGGTGVYLGGDSAGDHELFPVDPELAERESTLMLDYEVQNDRQPREIPLWIVPSLVPASDRRTLEIDLHWNHLGPDDRPLRLSMFDLIELQVPASWGTVEGSAPVQPETGRTAERRTIRWKQLKPNASGASSLTLTLRFERPITEVPEFAGPAPDDLARPDADSVRTTLTLTGTLKATFNGLLSGVTGVGVYLPGGGEGHRPPTKTTTKVAVTFDVSLRSIRYQDERVVPDENQPHDQTRADEFYGVVPDHTAVAELTKAISLDNYYVKSVVEHPPYRDERSGVLNRVWDVTGRRYIGLFPIDFDISLRGEEVDTPAGLSGKTVAQVTVKGTYATGTLVDRRPATDATDASTDLVLASVEADSESGELLRQIENTWSSLHARVTHILAGRAHRATIALPATAENVMDGELLDPGGEAPLSTGDVFETVTVVAEDRARQGAELRRQRVAADEAVIMGRISEETHRGIVARIEAARGELEGES